MVRGNAVDATGVIPHSIITMARTGPYMSAGERDRLSIGHKASRAHAHDGNVPRATSLLPPPSHLHPLELH